ncbi:MAG TPA: hypothetical protein VFB14_01145 [Bryobacteraceae bacterium]|nr:hypothetical protein [Bryobacteraceae bacterium]
MRKTILGHEHDAATFSGNEWLGVEAIAGIDVTSEADGAPVENVLYPDRDTGWRAGEPGPQIIRITFGGPTSIRRIQLVFRESQCARTQEFTLRCTVAGGERRELIRQQWTFSPQGSTGEVEDYRVTLDDVVVLELAIIPDIGGGGAHASLLRLRIG